MYFFYLADVAVFYQICHIILFTPILKLLYHFYYSLYIQFHYHSCPPNPEIHGLSPIPLDFSLSKVLYLYNLMGINSKSIRFKNLSNSSSLHENYSIILPSKKLSSLRLIIHNYPCGSISLPF